MSYRPFKPDRVYIAHDAANYRKTKDILSKLDNIEQIYIDDLSQVHDTKKSIVLARQKGNFYKNCPGTKNYICCGYQILNLVNNCEIDCTYCILQGYLNVPYILIYVNIDDMFNELSDLFGSNRDKYYRVGTGELADSLSTDHITGYSRELVEFFSNKSNAIIELKTKTNQIENFIDVDHGGRTVVSWSLNTPRIMSTEEANAPSLTERLAAAKSCEEAGFKIGFHFDPMIYYPEWEDEYYFVIEQLFKYIDPKSIIWISLGGLRYPPHLENIIKERHPKSEIIYGEFITGLDGKLRYFKSIRIEMFKKMVSWIKKRDPDIFTYICMGDSDVWRGAFGWTPGDNTTLKNMMDNLIK